jgi:IclR family mhp operon transcriptional activator
MLDSAEACPTPMGDVAALERSADGQSLQRGFAIVEIVNRHPGSCAASIASRCGIPRSSAQRILAVLMRLGFVYREEATRGYFPARGVERLSCGFDATARFVEAARIEVAALAPQVAWPVYFAAFERQAMCVQAVTDHVSPFAVEKLIPGQRLPVLQCAAGLAWLSAADEAECDAVVEAALRQPLDRSSQTRWSRQALDARLAEARRAGYALFRWPQRLTCMVGLAVPVRIDGRARAALAVRFAESAIPLATAVSRFLPHLDASVERLQRAMASSG